MDFGLDQIGARRAQAIGRTIAVLFVACLAVGCVAAPPTAPTFTESTIETVPVHVYAMEYGSDGEPLGGVTVLVNRRVVGRTDTTGLAVVQVSRGVPVTIGVDLLGYRGFSAEGTVWSASESWRFWLEELEAGAATTCTAPLAASPDCTVPHARMTRESASGS